MSSVFWLSYAALWLGLLVVAAGVMICIRQLGETYLILSGARGIEGDGLKEGRRAPDFELDLRDGRRTSMQSVLPAGGLILFASSDCRICERLVPELAEEAVAAPILVVYDRMPESAVAAVTSGIVQGQMIKPGVPVTYRVRATPFPFAIDSGHRIISRGLVNVVDQVRYHAALAADAAGSRAASEG